jgi:hypothetical protein
MRRGETVSTTQSNSMSIPDSLTPTGAALMLRRIEQFQASEWSPSERLELRADINAIQRRHFADTEAINGQATQNGFDANNLRPTVQRWTTRAAATV